MSIYQNALDVQSASNLSGVVLQFARDMKRINEEVRASGGGTEQVNYPAAKDSGASWLNDSTLLT
jgi:hypothetical protein